MNSKKRLFGLAAAVLLTAVTLTGCMGKKAASFSISDSGKETLASDPVGPNTSVSDKNGWKTRYDSTMFDMTHSGNDVIFTYIGEGGGTDVLTIGYVENKLPSEVLYDVTADVAAVEPERVDRYEGFFNADSGDWCYGRHIATREGTNEPDRAYTGVEHNGGTLLISEISTPMKDEANQNAVDSAIIDIRMNFEWTSHSPQQEFSYVVGTYERKYKEEIEGKEQEVTDTVTMNAGHTGTLSFQDDIDFVWSSIEIIENESGSKYEFTVEGDTLMINFNQDSNWASFERKK